MNQRIRRIMILSGFFLFLANPAFFAHAQPRSFQSVSERTGTIELFTSEGCSSCPPADDWLNTLDRNKELWVRWVPMAFHVDYWNYLGWKDPWSSAEFSNRQRAYADTWNSSSVYTPGMVLNGKEWAGWRGARNLPASSGTPKPGILKAEAGSQGEIKTVFIPDKPGTVSAPLFAHAAILGFDMVSNVGSGENRGRRLLHNFNVLEHTEAPMRKKENFFEAELDLPTLSKNQSSRRAVVFWISAGEDPTPIQTAAGEW